MLHKKPKKLTVFQQFSLILILLTGGLAGGKDALALTAADVLNKMNQDEQNGYIAGIIEGLAYSRWLLDRPDETGMNCIYDWYYNGKIEKHRKINAWLERHLDKPVGTLLYVLTKTECGELVGRTQ